VLENTTERGKEISERENESGKKSKRGISKCLSLGDKVTIKGRGQLGALGTQKKQGDFWQLWRGGRPCKSRGKKRSALRK